MHGHTQTRNITPHTKNGEDWNILSSGESLVLDTHNSMDVVQPLPFVFSYASLHNPVDSASMATWLLHSQLCPRQNWSSSWGNSTLLESRPVLSTFSQ